MIFRSLTVIVTKAHDNLSYHYCFESDGAARNGFHIRVVWKLIHKLSFFHGYNYNTRLTTRACIESSDTALHRESGVRHVSTARMGSVSA